MGVEEANPAGQPQTESPSPENVEALLEAARYDDIEDVTSLASAGVSLDSKDSLGRTALHMAAANGHLGLVEYLIRNGVDLNASNVDKNTPLHWACLNGHIEVVKSLILAGAHVSSLNSYERTPMDEALSQGKIDVIEAINTAVTQLELSGIDIKASVPKVSYGGGSREHMCPKTFIESQSSMDELECTVAKRTVTTEIRYAL